MYYFAFLYNMVAKPKKTDRMRDAGLAYGDI